MKTRFTFLYAFILLGAHVFAQHQPGMEAGTHNYTSFSSVKINSDNEVLEFNKGFEQHPELGHLYSNAPCEDCFEVIEKRTETSKFFLKKGSNGSYIYQQTSIEPMHVKDALGNDHTVISTLQPSQTVPGLFSAPIQPIPTGINTADGYAFVGKENQRIHFNRHLTLVFVPDGGPEQVIGAADWSHYTAGDDGVYITDAWPGIDMEMYVARGQIKTNYIIKNQLPQFSGGQLRIRDRLLTDPGLTLHALGENEFWGEIEIVDALQNVVFLIEPAIVYDKNVKNDGKSSLDYQLNGQQLDIIIPQEWINRDAANYPVVIDPLISGTANMAIGGSGYNATCFTGGCSYNLAVPVPAAITVTDIRWSFNYTAAGGCWLQEGAVDFQLGACRSPNLPGFFWFCNLAGAGTCNGNNVSIFNHLSTCVPAPNCASYNMNFTMKFYRCYGTGAGCSNACIGAATPWTMVVEGRTVEPTSLVTVLPAVTICQGSSTTLSATGQNGVPGYTYTWNPGALPGSPSVSPATSTNYTVTITDACGNTTTATKQVNVTLNNNPGFTISPNPACVGQVVTITGLGSGSNNNYDWLIPSSSLPVVNNTQVVNVTYAAAGTYPITLNYANGVCVFPLVQNITVNALGVPTANITAAPAGAICAGTNVTFTANITNGGAAPTYQWQVNGVNVGTNSSTYSSSTLNNGDVVTLTLTSNSPCAAPPTAVSNTIVMVVNPVVIPTINIVAAPVGAICAGTNVTFTANITNGGATPTYQWQVNGANVGTNSNTYSSTTLNNGDVVTCILTSSDPCASPVTATSNNIVMVVNPILVPTINIVAAPAGGICSGTNVTFTANITNGGAAPTYQWQVNGVNVGTNSNTYSSAGLNNGDIITCTLTSNAICASPTVVVSNQIIMAVTPTVIPTVNITALPAGPICAGTNVDFTANITNGGPNPTYQWQINGVNVGTNANTFSSAGLANGDVVTVILTSDAPCANPASVTSNNIIMVVNPLLTPTINIVSNPGMPVCIGSNVTFTANITNGGAGPTYQWQVNGANVGANTNTYTTNALVSGDVVTCILTSNALCLNTPTANSNSIVISNFPPVSIITGPDLTICQNEIVTLTATPAAGNPALYNVVWTPVNIGGNSITLSPNSTTTYTATVTDACGSTASATTTVTVNTRPVAAFTFAPNPPDLSQPPTVFTDGSTNAVSWLWNFGNGNTANVQNPSFEFTAGGTYPVILIVTSADGCTDTTMALLVFEDIYSLFIPSSFTPNEDEINPIFYAYGSGMKTFHMEIYDRWGESIFASDDINKGWNGILNNGTLAPQGVYNYKIDVEFTNAKTQTLLGKVTLLR
jgi:gliding motility-associated-like protein